MIDYNEFLDIMISKMSEKDNPEEIEKAFELFDEDGTGAISFDNLKRVAQELGEAISDDELREMIFEACKNRYGEVSAEQFKQILNRSTS
jgi:Ca2+-binding EF-hand superfamily protein